MTEDVLLRTFRSAWTMVRRTASNGCPFLIPVRVGIKQVTASSEGDGLIKLEYSSKVRRYESYLCFDGKSVDWDQMVLIEQLVPTKAKGF